MREIIVRTISGVLYILIVVFSMFTTHEWFMGLFFILALITMSEYLKLVHLTSYLAYFLLAFFLYVVSYKGFEFTSLFTYLAFYDNAIYLYLILTIFVNLFMFKDILYTSKIPMFGKKKYVVLILYMIGGFVFLTLIPFVDKQFVPKLVVGVFTLVWANDTFAYIVGKSIGKHKLLERISPKKTVEGFLGGLFGAMLVSWVIFYFIHLYTWQIWIGLAIISSVFGTIGDLVQSKFKRQAGVKDSGMIMPGHGGIYDRLDSIIYASPFLFAFLQIIDHVS